MDAKLKMERKIEINSQISILKNELSLLLRNCDHPSELVINHPEYEEDGSYYYPRECGLCNKWEHLHEDIINIFDGINEIITP